MTEDSYDSKSVISPSTVTAV